MSILKEFREFISRAPPPTPTEALLAEIRGELRRR